MCMDMPDCVLVCVTFLDLYRQFTISKRGLRRASVFPGLHFPTLFVHVRVFALCRNAGIWARLSVLSKYNER